MIRVDWFTIIYVMNTKNKRTFSGFSFKLSKLAYLVPGHIYIESRPFPFADAVVVWLFKVGPEFLMFIAVPWEVKHAGKMTRGIQKSICRKKTCMSTIRIGPLGKTNLGSSSKEYCTPWPWCTSQSTINTLKIKKNILNIQQLSYSCNKKYNI